MKQILLVIGLLFSGYSFGQTIDTSFHYCKAAQIQPIILQVNYPNYDTCNYVGVISANIDNTTNRTIITYYFGNTKRNVLGDTYIINDTNTRTQLDYIAIIGAFLRATFN